MENEIWAHLIPLPSEWDAPGLKRLVLSASTHSVGRAKVNDFVINHHDIGPAISSAILHLVKSLDRLR